VWNESFELELNEGYCFELALYCRGRWFFDHFLGSKKVVLPNGTQRPIPSPRASTPS
jgi:hypothetical protein